MEDPFLQTILLLHVNVGLAEDQIAGTAGPSHCAGNALPEQHHALARPLPQIVERVYKFVKIRNNSRCGGDLRVLKIRQPAFATNFSPMPDRRFSSAYLCHEDSCAGELTRAQAGKSHIRLIERKSLGLGAERKMVYYFEELLGIRAREVCH